MIDRPPNQPPLPPHDARLIDEGGLRAPPGLSGWRKAWWWFDFIVLVKLARLRFIAVLLVIGLVITQWDLLSAYYDKWFRPHEHAVGAAGDVEWFCPMHPTVVRDNNREKCPICFMPLSKRKPGQTVDEALPAGVVNRVQLSPYRLVLGGVRTWELDYRPVSKQIRATGFIEFNERGQKTVSSRMAGRIEELVVAETGQMVRAGDVLATLYSPDLNVTVQNLLDAKRTNNVLNLASDRRRLELLGIDDEQIQEIIAAGKPRTALAIRSPLDGHIIKKYIKAGQYIEQGMPLYDVADLSTVWVQAQVYEDDMQFLPLDQQHGGVPRDSEPLITSATTRSQPNEVFPATLGFVFPHVDQATRTLTIRCEIDNPGHKLRPGSTAVITLHVAPRNLPSLVAASAAHEEQAKELAAGRVLAVPDSAIIDTGAQKIVYRETVPGTFEGVSVTLGPPMTGPEGETLLPVLAGLERGERIVTAGSFLVDAETRLNPAAGSVYYGGGGSKQVAAGSTVRPSTPVDEDSKIAAVLARLPAEQRPLAEAQKFCVVLDSSRLGSMGPPIKLTLAGETVFICCEGCRAKAQADPQKSAQQVLTLRNAHAPGKSGGAR